MNVVVVEWNWSGHNPTYFAHFVATLEDLGCRVLAMSPRPDEARRMVERIRAPGSTAHRLPQTAFVESPPPRRSYWPFSAWRRAHHGVGFFLRIQRRVHEWERESGKRADLLFYACIHEWDFRYFPYARPFLRTPWAGLYLHPRPFRQPGVLDPVLGRPCDPSRIFRGSKLRAIALLDEGVERQVEAAFGKPVVVFPDFADATLARPEPTMVMSLKRFAADRPIVGLFGHLHRTKGVLPFARLAHLLPDVCFAMGGELSRQDFSPQERRELDQLSNGANLWTHFQRIPEEAEFNALLRACTVLYAAYVSFPHSSNMLAKAAHFQRPLVVSDGYLMAERVRQFRLGEVVAAGDPAGLVAAVRRLTTPPADAGEEPRDWAGYLERHSRKALRDAFAALLRHAGMPAAERRPACP